MDGTSFRLFLKISPLPIGPVASNTGPSGFPSGASCYKTAFLPCPVIPAYLRTLVCTASLDFACSSVTHYPWWDGRRGDTYRSMPGLFCPNVPFGSVDKSPCCLAHGGQEEGTDQPSWCELVPQPTVQSSGHPSFSPLLASSGSALTVGEISGETPPCTSSRLTLPSMLVSTHQSLRDSFRTLAHWQ